MFQCVYELYSSFRSQVFYTFCDAVFVPPLLSVATSFTAYFERKVQIYAPRFKQSVNTNFGFDFHHSSINLLNCRANKSNSQIVQNDLLQKISVPIFFFSHYLKAKLSIKNR